MNIKKLLFNNFGIKLVAFLLALFVWILIVGQERAYSEKSFEIDVDYINLHENLEIKSTFPEKVRIEVRGTRRVIDQLTYDSFKLEIDLKNIYVGSRITRWVQDYLQFPEDIEILSVRPRSLEILTEEFLTKSIPIVIKKKGKLNPGLKLLSETVEPAEVVIKGYKTKIANIKTISPKEVIDLSTITESTVFTLPLERSEDILTIDGDHYQITVNITVEKKDEKTKPKNSAKGR